jgi:hypothetical protein
MMLADNAQVADHKLFVMGGGWTQTSPGIPGALAGVIGVPWIEANRRHVVVFSLVEDSGEAVMVSTPDGPKPFFIKLEFEVGRPAGVRPGTMFSTPIGINYVGLPVQPGRRYEWRWTINNLDDSDWRLPFDVLERAQRPASPTG